MESSLKFEYYKNTLLSLKVAKRGAEGNLAKPVLMLAIIEEIERGNILGNKILFSESLTQIYEELFLKYNPKITRIEYPYYYLNSENFYYIKGSTNRKTPSIKYIRENIEYAYLDESLWGLLQDAEVRTAYKQAIIKYYIKTQK